MWGKREKLQEKAIDVPKYAEGTILRRNTDADHIALIVYKNLLDYQKDNGSILAAEFVSNGNVNGITFVQNVAVAENDVREAELPSYFGWFLRMNWTTHQKTGSFYRSDKAYNDEVTAQREENRKFEEACKRYKVTVEMVTGTVHEWPGLMHDKAVEYFNTLRTAQNNGTIWQSTYAEKERESISGKYIVSVNLL